MDRFLNEKSVHVHDLFTCISNFTEVFKILPLSLIYPN